MPEIGPGSLSGIQPVITVEIAFATDPLVALASQTWTDVSAYCTQFNTQMGRQHELGRMEAAHATVTLKNLDGRFDPTNTASPYYPNVVPARRLRIRAAWDGVTYSVFSGFVESWGEDAHNLNLEFMTVTAVDATGKMLANKNLLNPYYFEVIKDSPDGWWRFHESSADTLAADSAGSADAPYQGTPTLGGTGPVNDGTNSAVLFNGLTSDGVYIPATAAPSGTGAFSAECWFNTTVPTYMFRQDIAKGGWQLSLNGTLSFYTYDTSGSHTLNPAGNYDDGLWHHVIATRTAGGVKTLIVDGASIGTATTTSHDITAAIVRIGNPNTTLTFAVSMAEPAIYKTTAVSVVRALAHKTAATAWANDLSGTRVGRLLDAINWPSADRNIEAGVSALQAEPQPGNALTALNDTADSEGGLFFQGADGVLNFYQRSHLWTTLASTVSQATFGNAGGTELPYILPGLTPKMDDLDLWNDVQITRNGGALQEVQDTASQTRYSTRTLSLPAMKLTNDDEARQRAQHDLALYKDPAVRVRQFTITPSVTLPATMFPQALGRSMWDRVAFKRTLPGGGSRFSQESIIEGVGHTWSPGQWQTTFNLSPADPNAINYFILNDATRGVLNTSMLAY